jgi:hypothetical protein
MLGKVSLPIFLIAVGGMTASAADLPARSRIGAVFAEPDQAPPPVVYRRVRDPGAIFPFNQLPNPYWNQGNYNYGSSWSWYNPGPYYGGPYYADDQPRLPYVCGLLGYC